uniref:Uncharacterized protein n=2 Tax=Alexandrium monilatum TaxID=311494 RepID=A0A7S4Q8H4_9DINO
MPSARRRACSVCQARLRQDAGTGGPAARPSGRAASTARSIQSSWSGSRNSSTRQAVAGEGGPRQVVQRGRQQGHRAGEGGDQGRQHDGGLPGLLMEHAPDVERTSGRDCVVGEHVQTWPQDPQQLCGADVLVEDAAPVVQEGEARGRLSELFEHSREEVLHLPRPDFGASGKPCKVHKVACHAGLNEIHLHADQGHRVLRCT